MPFQVSPGVNVSEIDLTTVIPAVSTTEAGIAGHFRWGPVNKATLISSEDALVSQFQKPDSNTATDFFTAANFLAYGNALFVVRAENSTMSIKILIMMMIMITIMHQVQVALVTGLQNILAHLETH